MTKTCPILPLEINREYNLLTQEYSKQNIPLEEARRQAASDLLVIAQEELARRTLPDVILPIGTSGSGKSTFIKSLPQDNLVIISPDEMRVEFTGNMDDKSKDKEIYAESPKRAIQAIRAGKQVVFDTTNLTKDKRRPFIDAIKKAIPVANIQYKLMPLNPELAKQRIKAQLARGENRANVPDVTIDRHAESYTQMLEDIKEEPISPYIDRRTLGSQSNTTDQTTSRWEEDLLSNNLQAVFDRLGNEDKSITGYISDNHKTKLQSILNEMIIPLANKLEGYTLKVSESDKETQGQVDLLNKSIQVITNKSSILTGLQLSSQEVFSHETLHALTAIVLGTGTNGKPTIDLNAPTNLKVAARKLFNLGKSGTTWEDLLPKDSQGNVVITPGSTLAETEQVSKDRWNYIFNSENGLLEFLAFGNTNEQFMKALAKIKVKEDRAKPTNLVDAIKQWFLEAIEWLANKVIPTKGATVDIALKALTLQILGIKKKHTYFMDFLGLAGESVRFVSAKPIEKLLWGLDKGIDKLPDSRFKELLEGLKQFPRAIKSNQFAKGIAWMADRLFRQREYFIFNLLSKLPSELVGMTEFNQRFWARLRYSKGIIDVARRKMLTASLKNFKEAFRTPLSTDEDVALYYVMAMDLPKLKELGYSYDEITELINKTKAIQEIDKYKKELLSDEGDIAYGLIRQAQGLGLFNVSKETFNKVDQMLNAINIVDLKFDPDTDNKVVNREKALKAVEALISLYSITYMPDNTLKTLKGVFKRELSVDPIDNGIANYMAMIQVHRIQSLEKNFDGQERLVRSGYTADILDPNVSIKFSNDPNDKALIREGYTRLLNPLKKGMYAKHGNQYMYTSKFNGLVPFNKTTISLTSEQQFGTNLSDIYLNQGLQGKAAYIAAEQETQEILSKLSDPYIKNYDTESKTGRIPVTNAEGKIVGFRYVMSEATRASTLRKNYKASIVLATMYEQMTDKFETKGLNKKVVEDLVADRKQFGIKKSKDYITITDKHPKYGELYKRIPIAMKADLDAAFGKGKLIIREPLVDLVFGFPQYSLSKEGLHNFIGKSVLLLMKGIEFLRKKDVTYATLSIADKKEYRERKATMLLRQSELGWQEIVGEVKTAIILKTLVLPVNILSNLFFSFLHGMPVNYILKKQAEAVVALKDYNEKLERKLILENRVQAPDISAKAKQALQGQINQLKFDIDGSIVKSLIDKGVLNSIVEDVELDAETNIYSLKGQLSTYLEGKTENIPELFKFFYRQLYVTKSTNLFKLFETTTRYSDFVARYAMFEFLTKEKGIKDSEALATTMAAFVEYDPPSSKELQYLNDIGMFMFTKYTIRIQKAVAKLFLDKPDTAIGFTLLQHMLGYDVPEPTDSFLSASWNNAIEGLPETFMPLTNLVEDYWKALTP